MITSLNLHHPQNLIYFCPKPITAKISQEFAHKNLLITLRVILLRDTPTKKQTKQSIISLAFTDHRYGTCSN